MADLLLHPAMAFLAAALLSWWAPHSAGRVLLAAAPAVALVQLSLLGTDSTVTATYLGFDIEPMRADRLAIAFAWIFAIAAGITAIYGWRLLRGREPTALLAYAGAAFGVVLAGDLLTLFVFWEIKAIASTFVILERRGGNSQRAGMRYLFMHLVGGKLLLAGAVWHQADTGSLAFEAFDLGAATSLILVAFLLSAAVPPLHAWLTDAYPEASVVGTVALSAFTTKAAVYALARGFPGTSLLIWLGVAMALYGVVYAVLENDIRRLLGYHIISQVGYMVAAIGIGTQAALNGATAHAFAHILYKGLLLMGVGAVIHATGRTKMSELGGIANRMRGVLALYMVGAVSISSVPLFSGFVSKELAVDAASLDGQGTVVLLLKIASVGTFLHTGLKLPFGTWFGREGPGPRTNLGARLTVGPVPGTMLVAMGISAALNLAIGMFPGLLYDLLPFPVEYDPYVLAKVVEKSQVLIFTSLAFWLMINRMHAAAKISIDTDWFYRRPAPWLRDAFMSGESRPRPSPGQAAVATMSRATNRVESWLPTERSTPPIVPTWALGLVFLGSTIVILILSLVAS